MIPCCLETSNLQIAFFVMIYFLLMQNCELPFFAIPHSFLILQWEVVQDLILVHLDIGSIHTVFEVAFLKRLHLDLQNNLIL